MNMELSESQRKFKRVLKEIGVWSEWKRERIKSRNKHGFYGAKANSIPTNIFFDSALRTSFLFAKTEMPNMWIELSLCNHFSNDVTLKSDTLLKRMKLIVKHYYDK